MCKHCPGGRGYLYARRAATYHDSAGPWETSPCPNCGGKGILEDSMESYFTNEDAVKAHKWIQTAEPPDFPFRLYPHSDMCDPVELWEKMRASDPRFNDRQLIRLYQMFALEDLEDL